MNEQIEKNIKIHDAIAKKYEKEHVEIYNEIEQKRLRESLQGALGLIKTDTLEKKALDFGCGAGNLAKNLLQIGSHVTAADVSKNFLNLVKYKYSKQFKKQLSFLELNGKDLSNIEDGVFDFVAMYSVLHHVPDYLLAIQEFARVLKPGGVLYIDHEASPEMWKQTKDYTEYKRLLDGEIFKKTRLARIRHLFMLSCWKDAIKGSMDPRYKAEGDIHVFQDDHIEWDDIRKVLLQNRMEIISEDDFLLYTKYCPEDLYYRYKDKCNDIRVLVARKLTKRPV